MRFPKQIFTTTESEELRKEIRDFKEKFDHPDYFKINWSDKKSFWMEPWDDSLKFESEVDFEDVTEDETSEFEEDEEGEESGN